MTGTGPLPLDCNGVWNPAVITPETLMLTLDRCEVHPQLPKLMAHVVICITLKQALAE
jgi:hypothetical protein